MKDELTQQEQADVDFYNKIHLFNSHKVNGIWQERYPEKQIISGLSEIDQGRYYRGREFDFLGHSSMNGVPVTAEDIRSQLRKEGKYPYCLTCGSCNKNISQEEIKEYCLFINGSGV